MLKKIREYFKKEFPAPGGLEILKYIGPGLLVTVGFIDPGNWASNIAAGSQYGSQLLWMVTVSTVILIFLQHNAAHLGIVTGLCLSEAASNHFSPLAGRILLLSAVAASISTALAEILGTAIGLNMLTGLPLPLGSLLAAAFTLYILLSNNYRRIEKYIIGFVSLIGLSFIFELSLIHIHWGETVRGWFVPSIPQGSLPIIMCVLGAVVMPHNLYLHSEIIQSRQWNLENDKIIKKQLKYEYADTIIAMIIGWAINSAMIIVAASAFFHNNITVTELKEAQVTLKPLAGSVSSVVFALALIMAGASSSITASMAGGSIFAGMFGEPFNIKDKHSRTGIIITIAGALCAIFFLSDPFKGIIWSQILLSIQLPLTVFAQIILTSSSMVMGKYKNSAFDKFILLIIGIFISGLNILLFLDILNIFRI